jgi:hypothetical protein
MLSWDEQNKKSVLPIFHLSPSPRLLPRAYVVPFFRPASACLSRNARLGRFCRAWPGAALRFMRAKKATYSELPNMRYLYHWIQENAWGATKQAPQWPRKSRVQLPQRQCHSNVSTRTSKSTPQVATGSRSTTSIL